MRRLLVLLVFLASPVLHAGPMFRVVGADDPRTLILDQGGVAKRVTLAGVVVPDAASAAATDWLRSTLSGAWVMIDPGPDGAAYVYRSPDALFVNDAINNRVWDASRVRMVYLGESMPGPARPAGTSPATRTPKPRPAPRPRPLPRHTRGSRRTTRH